MQSSLIIQLSYLVSAVLFILGLKRLSSPATARGGNTLAALGMLVAVAATLLDESILDFTWIIIGIVTGGLIGLIMARTVKMTAMPQMVAVFNGFGGGASALVAAAEYFRSTGGMATDAAVSIMAGTIIGTATFSGSLIAFGKLQGIVTEKAVKYPLQRSTSFLIFLGMLALAVYLGMNLPDGQLFLGIVAVALALGVLIVIPIGGADMPVVVALLNSYSGLAASAAGFVLNNNALIIAGALVGASGLILTNIMCRAMNRSLGNVMFGAFGAGAASAAAGGPGGERVANEIDPEDAAMLMGYAQSVLIVPGYGLAVAQAQHKARELGDLLGKRGVNVKYVIHPVAGRMPGHMNVLLAEANVPYDQLYEPDDVNGDMENADVAIIIGANDVVNPAARDDPNSLIAGMPIIEVDRAKRTIVLKRSLNVGFAGIDNPLFYLQNNSMLFGDAAKSLSDLVEEVKQL